MTNVEFTDHLKNIVARCRNNTERAYALRLECMKQEGKIFNYFYEAHKIIIGHRNTFTPDFFIVGSDGSREFHEVKGGYIRPDAIEKFKTARQMLSMKEEYKTHKLRMFQKTKNGWKEKYKKYVIIDAPIIETIQ